MTITLDLKPETQEALSRQAAANGLDLDAYAVNILEEAATSTTVAHSTATEEFELVLAQFAQFSSKIPQLPESAFSRSSIYSDHD